MKKSTKIGAIIIVSFVTFCFAVFVGNYYISPREIAGIIMDKIAGTPTVGSSNNGEIIWSLRIPRVALGFLVGALLSVSGVIMQSILQNPLASSYTLGVSSGSALGVALYTATGFSIPFLGIFSRTVVGFVFGILTVIIIITIASKIDNTMGNLTIILLGMTFSLFLNAIFTLIMSLSKETLQQIMNWQMGSLALKDPRYIFILLGILLVGILVLIVNSPQLDGLTFGEELAFTTGIDVKKAKWIFLALAAAFTGASVAIVGIIGFIDLVIPHITRKLFGASHRIVIPMSALLGGSFLVISDIVARTIISPRELPVGVVTAIIGVPFFVYIYFRRGKDNA